MDGSETVVFTDILHKLANRKNLDANQAKAALEAIISGAIPEAQIAAFLFGMRAKGETVEEMTAFVEVMRKAAVHVDVDIRHAVDLCGTGGDNANTFNISTASMFVVAGAGAPVLKHGNRSVSSKSGSADVLEALGAVAALRKRQVEKVYNETGLAFMFAPYFHPAMKHVMPARKALHLRTFFNILGPLLNPAGVKRQVVGAYNRQIAHLVIQILRNLGTDFAYGINAEDGLDEFSTTTYTDVYELQHEMYSEAVRFDPRDLGIKLAQPEDLKGGDKDVNAEIIQNILKGKGTQAQQDIVTLNAVFGIHASGIVDHLKEAHERALESIASGKAERKLQQFVEATNDVSSTTKPDMP
ncbi:MAG TPA: anthranilate phosphoribosyltransferase [Balneolales bacterium]|nr:anthranilate phosphoribosyltransferase [Balneolales bacterium]